MLPARFPNLLVNGGQGIAVGMASNIPPHNLAEVCNAAARLIDKPDATIGDLMKHMKGPDFPTGGLIMGDDGIKDAFRTGRGTIRVRAVHEIEKIARGGQAIILTEVPYQTSVDAISGKLAELVESGKIDGVRDIRNESGQGKTRLVIELRADTNPQIVLNNLFKYTQAQTTFSVNMVALVDGVPHTLNLLDAMQGWLDHQVVVVTRRTQFRLDKAEARLHIIEGLVKAVDMIDAIIKAIRASKDRACRARRVDEQAVRVLRDPGEPHPRHAARPAHPARDRGAHERAEGAASHDQRAAANPVQARRVDGRDPRGAHRDPRRAQGTAPYADRQSTTPVPSTSSSWSRTRRTPSR